MSLPKDYAERVYAGVLGKIIGVYLGRPFEGWPNDKMEQILGEVWYYVNDRLAHNPPLIITDDDISGTFTFIRALREHGIRKDLPSESIGKTWLNNIIEDKTILWWGGVGTSTGHTAYMRLKHGIAAPRSGSLELNGPVVAQQVGAQIFIDGWGLVCPGNPEQAARFAKEAGSVSHDGEAVHGAQVIAALLAEAFVEKSIDKLLDTAVSFIPKDCLIAHIHRDVRAWHKQHPDDWRATYAKVKEKYGYDKFGGGCHMVPNHALIILALLHGEGDFQKSLMIVNTSGWDTDCNSGNVGSILGVRNGLDGICEGADFRGPVADRMLLPTALGGDCITDALREAYTLIEYGHVLAGQSFSQPKGGARFHFSLPDSVQGFQADARTNSLGVASVENAVLPDGSGRALAVSFRHLGKGQAARAGTPTFSTAQQRMLPSYSLISSPSLYPSQIARARVVADTNADVSVRLYVRSSTPTGQLVDSYSDAVTLSRGDKIIEWQVPDVEGPFIEQIGIEVTAERPAKGTVYLDYLTWANAPTLPLIQSPMKNDLWRAGWIVGSQRFTKSWGDNAFDIGQNEGMGTISIGTRDWKDYTVSANMQPRYFKRGGIAARFQGLRRFYALMLTNNYTVQLVRWMDTPEVLAEAPFPFEWHTFHQFELTVNGNSISGSIDGKPLLSVVVPDTDPCFQLLDGGIAVVAEDGTMTVREISIKGL